jgi:hypothetical protein
VRAGACAECAAGRWATTQPAGSLAALDASGRVGRGFVHLSGCCMRMKPSYLSYLFVGGFSVLALAAVLLPEAWLPSSERYVLGAAFLVVAAILLPPA